MLELVVLQPADAQVLQIDLQMRPLKQLLLDPTLTSDTNALAVTRPARYLQLVEAAAARVVVSVGSIISIVTAFAHHRLFPGRVKLFRGRHLNTTRHWFFEDDVDVEARSLRLLRSVVKPGQL